MQVMYANKMFSALLGTGRETTDAQLVQLLDIEIEPYEKGEGRSAHSIKDFIRDHIEHRGTNHEPQSSQFIWRERGVVKLFL